MNRKELENDTREFYEKVYTHAAPPKANSLDARKVLELLARVQRLKDGRTSHFPSRAATCTGYPKGQKKGRNRHLIDQRASVPMGLEGVEGVQGNPALCDSKKNMPKQKVAEIAKASFNRNISTAATLHNAKKDWRCYMTNTPYNDYTFRTGTSTRVSKRQAFANTPADEKYKYRKVTDLQQADSYPVNITPDPQKHEGLIRKLQPMKMISQPSSPERQVNTNNNNQLPAGFEPHLKLRIRTIKTLRESRRPNYDIQQTEMKSKPNEARPKFSEVAFSGKFRDPTPEPVKEQPHKEIIQAVERKRWYDYRPRQMINHYYRRNFASSNGGKGSGAQNKLTVSRIWHDAIENYTDKNGDKRVIAEENKACENLLDCIIENYDYQTERNMMCSEGLPLMSSVNKKRSRKGTKSELHDKHSLVYK